MGRNSHERRGRAYALPARDRQENERTPALVDGSGRLAWQLDTSSHRIIIPVGGVIRTRVAAMAYRRLQNSTEIRFVPWYLAACAAMLAFAVVMGLHNAGQF